MGRMMKRVMLFVLSMLIILLSCEHNVYIDVGDDEGNIWRVGERDAYMYFETVNEAVEYIMALSVRSVSKTEDENRIITLMRPVLAEGSDGIIDSNYEQYVEDASKRGNITVPSTFTGDLTIDFNGYRYDFANENEAFFVINGGDNVYIYNGTSVIFNEASHEPYAISVDTKTVTIDEHLLDDRRTDPNAVHVKSDGELVITAGTERENTYIKGGFKVEGNLLIENGVIYIGSIKTTGGSSLTITGGKIHSPHDTDDIILPAIDEEEFEKNNGEHVVVHEWSTTPYMEEIIETSTCSKEGKKRVYYKCTKCNETKREVISIAKVDHDHSGNWITTNGTYHWRICPVCKNEIDKAEHSFTDWKKDENDIWHRHCTGCGREEENAHLTHNLIHHPYTAPTCEKNGNEEYWSCSICRECFSDKDGTKLIDESTTVITKLGHDWDTTVWSNDNNTHWRACKRTGCTARDKEAEHINEYYYSALSTEGGTPFLTISHKCNVCDRSVSTEHKREDGAFHVTPLDGFSYAYDRTTKRATITVSSPKEYTSLLWYDINGKVIKDLNEKQCRSFSFEPDDKYGFRCELINNNKVIESCYIELTQYK